MLPIVGGALAGITLEKGLTSLFGGGGGPGGKKDLKFEAFGEHHAPYETWSPTTTYAQSYQMPDYNIIMDSPFARAGSKKEATVSPDVTAGVTKTEGVNMTHIAMVGAAALVLYGVTKK